MTESDDMLRGHVLRTVQSIEAEAKARTLLRDLEGNALHECAEAAALGGADVNADDICAAREVLELDPIPSYDDGGDMFDVADGLDDAPTMFEDALEAFAEGRYSFDHGWTVRRVGVLLGFGGPNIWLYWDGDSAHVEGYWGGSEVNMPILDDMALAQIAAALEPIWDAAQNAEAIR